MKVLLTHGYFLEEDEKEREIMKPYPPLGLLYISAFLQENGIENRVWDSTFSSFETFKDFIAEHRPQIIAIYTNLMTKVNVIKMAKEVKRISPETKVILGGPDVTYNIENYLNHGADFLVIGEGENSMLELSQYIVGNCAIELREIAGIAFLDKSGCVIKTTARTKIRELDELPVPNRSAIEIEKYLEVWKTNHGESAMNISTQRGCPYTCKWCSTAVYGQSYRRRSPKLVVQELKELVDRYNPDTFWFVDDVFTVSHKWLREFQHELDKEQLNIKFECISRADRMNAEVIAVLKKAGCFRVWIGAESGSQKIIDAMDRRVSVYHVRDMIIEAQRQGIQAGTFIMLGYPGETKADIQETINHLKASNPDQFTITLAYPIKGTDLDRQLEGKKIVAKNWEVSTDRDIDYKRTYNRRFYNFALKRVINEVNYAKYLKKKMYQRALMFRAKSAMAYFVMLFFAPKKQSPL